MYQANRSALLKQADLEFRDAMTKLMIRNMEVAVPERLADWLDPQVDPRVLNIPEKDIQEESERYREEMAKARKRLRTAALFESMHALRVLEPAIRNRVLEAAIDALKARDPQRNRKGAYPFERSLRALAKLAGSDDLPRLLQLDSERRPNRRRFEPNRGLTIEVDDPEAVRAQEDRQLESAVRSLRTEIQNALQEDRLLAQAREPGLLVSTAEDAMARWGQGLQEAEANLQWRAELFHPKNWAYAREQLNRSAWESLGWGVKGEWEALKAQYPDVDPISQMRFDKGRLFGNVANLGNANAVLGIVQAYRKAGPAAGQREEAVRQALLMEMISRLPYAGELMQVESILSGTTDPILGSGLMLGSFLYPGVGQAQLVYALGMGIFEIVYEIKRAEWVQREYQGSIPNNDGSPGPGKSTDPAWNDKPGVLHDVYAWTIHRHFELQQEVGFYEGEDKLETQRLLDTRFPKSPVLRHVEANIYDYYRVGLEQALRRNGHPESEWEAIQLSSTQAPILSNEPADLVNAADLPPMLRAFFGKFAKDYIEGNGLYADLEGHREARNHPLHQALYFHTEDPAKRAKAIEDLATVTTAAYMRSLLAQAQGKDTGLVIDPAWDARALTGTDAYLRGLPAENFAQQSASQFPGAAPAPALPALLDVVPGGPSAFDANFFGYFDGLLNQKIAAFQTEDGRPRIDDPTAFKLGKHHPLLRPLAPENQAVAHPLLLAYFNKVVHDYWERRTAAEGEVLPPAPAVGPAGEPLNVELELLLGPIDVGSVGASETTGAPMDPWPLHQFEPQMKQGYKDMVQPGIVQALIQRYKAGLIADYARRRAEADRAHLHRALPAAAALGRMKDAIVGNPMADAQSRPLARDLARHEFVPNLSPDPDFVRVLEAAYRGIPDDVEIEIQGVPAGPVGLGSSFRLEAEVRASNVHYERPYRVDWEFSGVGQGESSQEEGASPSLIAHRHRHNLGEAESGLQERSVTITATVTDATGKPMGTSTASMTIGGLDAIVSEEESETDPGGGANWGDGEIEAKEPEVIERVVYVIRVEGQGWVPHYAGASHITSGYNHELLFVKNGADPQALIDAYRQRLIGKLCEKDIPPIPGLVKRPVIWSNGPKIQGVVGPLLTEWEAYDLIDFEYTWAYGPLDGPSITALRGVAKCK